MPENATTSTLANRAALLGGPKIAVLTSGGDAQGMNAAVRGVVRTALNLGADVYAVMEGWQGAVDGGDGIQPMEWDSVSGIQHRGGTIIGTARCAEFRERSGMRKACANLVEHGIDRLVVIGGDGSLSGTDEFRGLWPELLEELVAEGRVSRETADRHPVLRVVGLVGSIDNDLVGTETTIGADTALHRIIWALDAISSTAASHHRAFVVEVMGRRCGYLPLMAALAGSCDDVFVPEAPPGPGWPDELCEHVRNGRRAGRRQSIVLVAEGAVDSEGTRIEATDISEALHERMGEDVRVTILGHVQRGGTPSAYDRWMSSILGHAAAHRLLGVPNPVGVTLDPQVRSDDDPVILGVHGGTIHAMPLVPTVAATRAVAGLIAEGRHDEAVDSRGPAYRECLDLFGRLSRPVSTVRPSGRRIGVMHLGGLAPGMNAAVAAAVRTGTAHGHTMVGIEESWQGLVAGQVRELGWDDVEDWIGEGGAMLGTHRSVPQGRDLYRFARGIESSGLDGLVVIGGWAAYETGWVMRRAREQYPAFELPMTIVPTTIDNNCPGTEQSVGADSALAVGVDALDRIKQSASASRRVFVAEAMGRQCGYLALMSGLAAGAERVYLPETGLDLADINRDASLIRRAFESGRHLFLAVRGEGTSDLYTTDLLVSVFQQESRGLYDARPAVIGHVQQGGAPSPWDRIIATRMAARAVDEVHEGLRAGTAHVLATGLRSGEVVTSRLSRLLEDVDQQAQRPLEQWWLPLTEVLDTLAHPRG